jgi:hypothetical protein
VHHCDRNTIAMIMTLFAGDPARKFAIARVVLAAALACWSGGASGQTREPTPAEQAYVEHERAVSQYNAAANDPFAGEVTIVRVAIAGDYPAEIVAAPETWEVPVGAMPPAGPIEARAEGGPTKKGKPYLGGDEDRNLAQTQPRPSGWNANLPPVEYDHPFKGQMTIRIASTKALAKICYLALTTEACARLRAGICEIYIASDFYRDQIMLRHEIGHCNGWGSHHFGMRWVKTSD